MWTFLKPSFDSMQQYLIHRYDTTESELVREEIVPHTINTSNVNQCGLLARPCTLPISSNEASIYDIWCIIDHVSSRVSRTYIISKTEQSVANEILDELENVVVLHFSILAAPETHGNQFGKTVRRWLVIRSWKEIENDTHSGDLLNG